MNWAKELALKIVEERPNLEVYTVASGISPSGYVHIGNFREVVTPYLVYLELKKLGKKVRYILSWDEFDRYRKTPGNIDQKFNEYIGTPYVDIPSPFNEGESYAKTFEDMFLAELKRVNIEPESIYQGKEYRSGRYYKQIIHSLNNRKEIFDIITSYKTQDFSDEEKETYYPISVYCTKCGKDCTKVLNYDEEKGEIRYFCNVCGIEETIKIEHASNIKLVWKVDWAMRWKEEQVVFECGGRDHSSEGGSFQVARDIAKKIFNYEAPIYQMYEFIGIKGGETKMCSSKGNVLTLTDLFRVYDPLLILWFYGKYKPNVAFDIALDNDVIRYYSEFDRSVKAYYDGVLDPKNASVIELIGVTKDYLKNPSFSYMATFLPMVNYNVTLLKELLEKEGINTKDAYFDDRLELARNWVTSCGADYKIELLSEFNKEFYDTLTVKELSYLDKTIEILSREYSSSDDLQTDLYSVVKEPGIEDDELKKIQKRYFQILYQLLLGSDKGPKMGLFLMAIPKEDVIKRIRI